MKKNGLIIIFLLLMSCDRTSPIPEESSFELMDMVESANEMSFEMVETAPSTKQPSSRSTSAEDITQKLIKNGYISFESENVQKDYGIITKLIPHFDAYLENENQSNTIHQQRYDLSIRVAAKHYDSLYKAIVDMAGKIENKSSSIQDVTERYYDLQARIKNKTVLEKRYLELLTRAIAIKDILEIEKNLNEVRIDIERLQGQFNYLNKQVNYSTIQVRFYEQLPYTYDSSQRKGFGARTLNALGSGWQTFLSFLVGTLSIWPFLVVLAGAILLIRRSRSIWKKKKGT